MADRGQTGLVRVLTAIIAVLLVLDGVAAASTAPAGSGPKIRADATTTALPSPGSAAPSATTATPNPGTTLPKQAGEAESSLAPSTANTATPPPTFPTPPIPDGWDVAGQSVQGRPILVRRFGHGPFKVLWVGGIHGDEIEGSVATANLPAAFHAAGLDDKVTLTIIWDANPDGRAAHTRTNHHGVDLNRDFPALSFGYGARSSTGKPPLSQPESRAVYNLAMTEQPNLIVACHSWRGDQFINYDGPAASLAARFSSLSGFPVKTTDQIGGPYDGSLGHWGGIDMGIASLTIEWLHGTDPQIAWRRASAAILAVITP